MFINNFNIIDIAILIKILYMSYEIQRNTDRNFSEIEQADSKLNIEKQQVRNNNTFLKNRIRRFVITDLIINLF